MICVEGERTLPVTSHWSAAIAHDLRQAVALIQAALLPLTHLISRCDDVRAQGALDGIHIACRSMDQMLAQALDLSRLEAGVVTARLTRVEVLPLLSDLVAAFGARAEGAGVRLVILCPQTGSVIADPLLLHRLLGNLLENAIAASPAAATVVLASRPLGNTLRLQVRDRGPGIARQDQARIFDEFERLPGAYSGSGNGTGLGLAICRRLALLMNASVGVFSASGRGCCMTVRLPGFEHSHSTIHPQRDSHV